jgi:hypothetical protein
MCSQHHIPRAQCKPWDRHNLSARYRDDDRAAAEADAERLIQADRQMDVTRWLNQAAQARAGYLRCFRCRPEAPAVPVEMGDLTGMSLSDAITAADAEIVAQHPDHRPVLIGSRAEQAATRERVPRPRTEPPAPVPAQARKAPRQPEETSPVAAESSSAAAARQIADGIPGVTTASELTGPAAVFRSFDPADEPFTPPAVPVPAVPERAKRGLAKPECAHIVSAGTRCKICEPAR